MKVTALLVFLFLITPLTAQRIYVDGNIFKVDGKQIWINGTNTPWNRWNEFGGNFDEEFWREEFERLTVYGVNSTRVWLSCDADGHIRITDSGYVTGPADKFWTDLDKLMEIAETYQIYIMATPISFDHTRQGRDRDAWRNMYASADNRQSFVENYIKDLVIRYNDNPWFFAVDVANEIEWVWENHGVDRDDVIDLIARVANAVHDNSDILVTQGMGAGPKYCSSVFPDGNLVSDESLSSKQPGAYLDFYKLHYYEWQNQWFSNPFDRSPGDWGIDDKPCVIGECRANGTNAGYTYREAVFRAFDLGWQGIMPWTSNPIGHLGSIYDHGPGSLAFTRAYPELVYPVDGPQTVAVTGVQIIPPEDTMIVGTTLQLTVSFLPENASNTYVSWNSRDETIATVNSGGLVAALTPGNASIGIETHDGGYKANAEITVIDVATVIPGYSTGDANGLNREDILIAPNPAGNFVTIKTPVDESGFRVAIVDMKGTLIRKGTLNAGENLLCLDNFEPGIYFIRISNKRDSYTTKLLIK
ncbi:MAG: T9SS C-terminal target domain-containing protein [Marinilabiliales bacterium]|nr:MAG: T9SS C-terminal target domain-containing protein [Marinilabiliales bacterium]